MNGFNICASIFTMEIVYCNQESIECSGLTSKKRVAHPLPGYAEINRIGISSIAGACASLLVSSNISLDNRN